MTRSYKLFKVSKDKEKLVKIFTNMQEATRKVRSILGLKEFQKYQYVQIYDGVTCIGMDFNKNGETVFRIKKEIQWDI